MTPMVFLYVSLFTVLIAAAAAAAEWGAQGRMSLRNFWSVAIVLALLVPPAAIAWASLAPRDSSADAQTVQLLAPITVRSGAESLAARSAPAGWLPGIFTTRDAAIARRAAELWLVASLGLAGWITLGMWRWRRTRRTWEHTTLDGIAVDVSPATGPAVLGVVSQRIVLPSWATEMSVERRRLMLAHECEHIAARDPQRLAIAAVALVLMPWNAALWWCVARLRRAIELDCDARVLRRFPASKEYGYLLLEVAERGRRTGALAIPFVGLLRVPSELELRLRAITRPRSAARRALIGGATTALVAVGAAFTTPIPRIAPGVDSQASAAVGTQSRDTVPAKRSDSTGVLQRRIDSLQARALKLEEQRRTLAQARARLDSAAAMLRVAQQQVRADRSGPVNPNMTYFDFEVDTPVTQKASSIAPAYPAAQRAAKQSGEVDTRFVVDTNGHADMTTFAVIRATDPAFTEAVRHALPRMEFNAAKVGQMRVRQLVQQPFMFSIAP